MRSSECRYLVLKVPFALQKLVNLNNPCFDLA